MQQLSLAQKLFLRFYCYPPPGRPAPGSASADERAHDPLAVYAKVFGASFEQAIADRTVLDIGCGDGYQVLALARRGARMSIGAESRMIYQESEARARREGLADRVHFTTTPMQRMAPGSVDVVLSQNAFEHFSEPDRILAAALHVLERGGKFFITFSPPWLNPFGVHMFHMIRYPWAHFLFSERTIMTVRKLYRQDNAERYADVEGGLNRMTIGKFLRYVRRSGFRLERLIATPIRFTPPLLHRMPGVRELVTSRVSAVLLKP